MTSAAKHTAGTAAGARPTPLLPIPEMTGADVAFGNIKHLPRYHDLPEDFRRHDGNDFCRAISTWFFRGAEVHPNGIEIGGVKFTAKAGIDPNKALAAIRVCMVSWEPKHEHKEAGCAYMLSQWFDRAALAKAEGGAK